MIILFCISANIFAEKTKHVEIMAEKGISIYAYVKIDDNNKPYDTTYCFMMHDAQYQVLTEMMTIYDGHYTAILNFLDNVEKFAKENEPGMSTTIENKLVYYEGNKWKGINIRIHEKEGNGYCIFAPKYIPKFKQKIIDWKNNNSK